jgi:hypothetical protein
VARRQAFADPRASQPHASADRLVVYGPSHDPHPAVAAGRVAEHADVDIRGQRSGAHLQSGHLACQWRVERQNG